MTRARSATDGGYGPALLVVLLLGVPLIVGCVLIVRSLAQASPLLSAADEGPLIATVTATERTDPTTVTATVRSVPSFTVLAQTPGVITKLGITPGVAINHGQVVYDVNGLPVVAYVSDAPLYRDIAPGVKGDDVATAQQLLVTTGHLRTANGTVNAATERAIRAFNKARGREADGTTLVASSLLWVPKDGTTPGEVTVRVGASLESGAELYKTAAAGTAIVVDAEPLDAPRVLTIDGVAVELPAGATEITDPTGVSALRAALGTEESGSGSLALSAPRTVGVVPASAVVTDETGTACFFADVTGPATVLTSPAGAFGNVDVPPELVGSPVLVNPRTHRTDLSCAS